MRASRRFFSSAPLPAPDLRFRTIPSLGRRPTLGETAQEERLGILRYIADNWDTLQPQVVTHFQIVLITIAVAGVAGITGGVLASRSERFSTVSVAVTSGILTIPSFALFGVLAIWFGIGNLP